MVRSPSAPNLTKFSQYKAPPKYSILGKRKNIDYTEEMPASNKYDVREMVTKTSKFRNISQPCSIGNAPRWPKNYTDNLTGGPGQYNTAKSTISKSDISFSKSLRPDIMGRIEKHAPGPGLYEVRGKNRMMEPTLSPRTCKQGGRHGWYYEDKEAGLKPGPGQYKLNHTQVEISVCPGVRVGTSLRPSIESHLGVGKNASTGPGQYKTMSTLGGNAVYAKAPSFSFTTAGFPKPKVEEACPDFILQPSSLPPK